jgi:hypothetical protein
MSFQLIIRWHIGAGKSSMQSVCCVCLVLLVCLSIRAVEPLSIAPGVKLEKIAGDFGFTELTPSANTLPYQPMNMHDHKFSRRNFLWIRHLSKPDKSKFLCVL